MADTNTPNETGPATLATSGAQGHQPEDTGMTNTDHSRPDAAQAWSMVGKRPDQYQSPDAPTIGREPKGRPDQRLNARYAGRCAECGYGFRKGRQIAWLSEPVWEWHTKAQDHTAQRTMDWECYLKRLRAERECEYCGVTGQKIRFHIDHIEPRSKDGDDEPHNFAVACSWCNTAKSDTDPEKYVEWLANSLCGWAIRYAASGLHVFPLKPGDKEPITRRGFKDATVDLAVVRRWWHQHPTANIGIATGASGLLVVDIDSLDAAGKWAAMENHHGPTNTLMAHTGRGGLHVIYAGTAKSTTSRIRQGIDTKSDGGYIVAPPSVHPNGNRYEWSQYSHPIAAAPEWLTELVSAPRVQPAYKPMSVPRTAIGDSAYGLAALRNQCRSLADAGEGERNKSLNVAAFNIGQLVGGGELTEATARDHLLSIAETIGLPEWEATKTITSGLTAGRTEPRNAPARAA